MAAVWIGLHHAKPTAPVSKRMDVMMSHDATVHATIAQRLYGAEDDHDPEQIREPTRTPSSPHAATNTSRAGRDTKIINESDLYSLRVTLGREEYFRQDAYSALGKILGRSPGYYYLPIELAGPNKSGSHALCVVSQGKGYPLTVFDSNLGECSVPPSRFSHFMQEMSGFYDQSRELRIIGVRGVQRIHFLKNVDDTPLGPLAKALD